MLFLYDYEYKTIASLRGHVNDIKELASDNSGRWLATFDEGPNNRVVVWDTDFGIPVKTIYINNEKADNLIISPNGKYLIVSFYEEIKSLHFYIWASRQNKPAAKVDFDLHINRVLDVTFSSRCEEFFVVTTVNHIIFLTYSQDPHEIEFHNPEPTKHWPEFVEYACSVYHDEMNICYSATSEGDLAIWGDDTIERRLFLKSKKVADEDDQYTRQKNAPLTNNLHGKMFMRFYDCKIVSMRFMDSYLVCLDQQSVIYFYTTTLTPIWWFDGLSGEGIKDFQFNLFRRICEEYLPIPESYRERTSNFLTLLTHSDAKEEVIQWQRIDLIPVDEYKVRGNKTLKIRDMVIQTKNNRLVYFNPMTQKFYPIFADAIHTATTMDTNPVWNYLCIGCSSGYVYLYDYDQKEKLSEQVLMPKNAKSAGITSVKFSPDGFILACGMSDGTLLCLHPLILKEIPEKYLNKSKASINLIEFCINSSYMAYADEDMIVALFAVARKFTFIGMLKAHHGSIKSLAFSTWNSMTKLYSIGEDRYLNEYDVQKCLSKKCLETSRRIIVELESIPLTLLPSPISSKILIISLSNFQFRMLDTDTMLLDDIRKAPNLTFPVHKLLDLECGLYSGNKYYLFASGCKLGVIKGPIDGNPFKWMTIRTGTSKIKEVCASRDGLYGFTINKNQFHVDMWRINSNNLDFLERIGGQGLTPFYALFKRGRNNPTINLLQDMYCLALMQHHGVYNLEELELNKKREVTLCEMPSILRAMGIFPSNFEMDNLMKMKSFKSGLISEHKVTFNNLAILFFNIQDESDFTYEKVKEAFQTICSFKSDIYSEEAPLIKREDFIKCFEEEGEKFSPLESYNYFRTLTGHVEGDFYYYNEFGDLTDYKFLPPKISLNYFVENIMGFKCKGMKYEAKAAPDDVQLNVYVGEPYYMKAMAK